MARRTSSRRNEARVRRVAREFTQRAVDEHVRDQELFALARTLLPQYGMHWNVHGVAVLKRQSLSRVLYYADLYRQVVGVPGVICEFGVQWGATLSLLINLRGMYEPFNHSRTIVGFDTFTGFGRIDARDGALPSVGDYTTPRGYEKTLERLLELQESFCPLPHLRKFELVKGDASKTCPAWLERNPHAIVAMAILDMDVYRPTRDVLRAILPRLTRGSLLVFDELSCAHLPGETAAVQEVLGLNRLTLRRSPHQPHCAWAVYGE
jgi:hypothetical protein